MSGTEPERSLRGLELMTERLILRVTDPARAPQVRDYLIRNRAFFDPWSPTVDEEYYTLAAQQARLEREQAWMDDGRAVRFWLYPQADPARVIGDLAFSNIVRGAFQSCHLGYKLDSAENGRGLMAEALRRAIRFAFEDLRLHRIEANIMPRNQRSLRLVERLGFVDEGLSRKYLKINGLWEDHRHFVLLNPDEE